MKTEPNNAMEGMRLLVTASAFALPAPSNRIPHLERSAKKMPPISQFSELIRMLESFIDGKDQGRGTIFVREIESEFARLGLDDEEEFSDLQHAFAMYRGHEEDIRNLKSEATFAVRRLATR